MTSDRRRYFLAYEKVQEMSDKRFQRFQELVLMMRPDHVTEHEERGGWVLNVDAKSDLDRMLIRIAKLELI